MPTNTTESGFETLIVNHLVEQNGFEQGTNDDYNREYALDETRLFRFLEATQPKQLAKPGLPGGTLKRAKFLTRLRDEITKRGIVDVLRKGVKVYPADLILFYMTPSEKNEAAKFLPFDRGCRDGAGNPPNPDGLMTDYLWKDIFTKVRLANIIENYAQTVEETDPETGRKSLKQIFPRYHQLAVVSALLAEVRERDVGEALHIPEPAFAQAALAPGGRPFRRHHRGDRPGQLPRGGPNHGGRSTGGRRRGDRPCADRFPARAHRPGHGPADRILNAFNDLFGNIAWTDADNVRRQVSEIPAMVAKDERYRNAMKNSDEQNARLESDRALQQVIFGIMTDNMELFKQFQDNPSFKQRLSDTVFAQTYRKGGGE